MEPGRIFLSRIEAILYHNTIMGPLGKHVNTREAPIICKQAFESWKKNLELAGTEVAALSIDCTLRILIRASEDVLSGDLENS